MIQTILIILILILFLFTDFDGIFIDILDTVFEVIKYIILTIFLIKRFVVNMIVQFLYDILFEPIIYFGEILLGFFKNGSK